MTDSRGRGPDRDRDAQAGYTGGADAVPDSPQSVGQGAEPGVERRKNPRAAAPAKSSSGAGGMLAIGGAIAAVALVVFGMGYCR